MITEKQFIASAKKIGCHVAAVKAVATVESSGGGFLESGKPKILFEPHIFWKQLRLAGIKPVVSDICYPVWKTKPYGKVSEQHSRLERAAMINRDAALMSASWGVFQIMGFNYKKCGCATLQEFINGMYESEDKQLELFVNYIINSHLDDELINLDWSGFARGYNGASYAKNNYHTKLKNAYVLFKK
jgi:hypothetical protein